MSHLSALLTSALNLFHLSSYPHPLQPLFLAISNAISHPGTLTSGGPIRKRFFDWLLSSDPLPLNNPDHPTLLHCFTGYYSSHDLSFFPSPIASKCTWQVLPDHGSNHLLISITISIFPITNSTSRPPSINYNKVHRDEYLFYIDTHCPSPSSFTTLSLSNC